MHQHVLIIQKNETLIEIQKSNWFPLNPRSLHMPRGL